MVAFHPPAVYLNIDEFHYTVATLQLQWKRNTRQWSRFSWTPNKIRTDHVGTRGGGIDSNLFGGDQKWYVVMIEIHETP